MATADQVRGKVNAANLAMENIKKGVTMEEIDIVDKLYACKDRIAEAWNTENGRNTVIALEKVIHYMEAPINTIKGTMDGISKQRLKFDEEKHHTGRYSNG